MQVRLSGVDHLVLTVADIGTSAAFYARALGMEVVTFGAGRTALAFGNAKINLHQAGREFEPKAAAPAPGTGDFCLIAETPVAAVAAHLAACGVPVELGPVRRTGALGPLLSLYLRDPDGNLVEVANRLPE